MEDSSTAGRPADSALMFSSRMRARMSKRFWGRRREPMCSALNGGLRWGWSDMMGIGVVYDVEVVYKLGFGGN